jgi:hypothetical protein
MRSSKHHLFRIEIFRIILAAPDVFQKFGVALEMEENRRRRKVEKAFEVGRRREVEAEGLQLGVGLQHNRTAGIRHHCRKKTVLCCHRCLMERKQPLTER